MTDEVFDLYKTIKVLILEDLPEDAELMKSELENEGFIVDSRVVSDAVAFESTLEHFKPEVILADYKLPKTSGLEALMIAQRKAPDVPFVFVTGTIGEEIAAETILNGASGLLLKKNISKLPKMINDLLSSKSKINHQPNSVLGIDSRIQKNLEALNRIQAFIKKRKKVGEISEDLKLTISQLKSIQDDLKEQNRQ
ncbi:response regulator [Reichenbachiella sp. MALMAid0571]|uniref:response regulator n=1 Tax=Reichenbachiella sp. MALMAid0571 TaxID=3143939 RepID=UPI0032DE90A7